MCVNGSVCEIHVNRLAQMRLSSFCHPQFLYFPKSSHLLWSHRAQLTVKTQDHPTFLWFRSKPIRPPLSSSWITIRLKDTQLLILHKEQHRQYQLQYFTESFLAINGLSRSSLDPIKPSCVNTREPVSSTGHGVSVESGFNGSELPNKEVCLTASGDKSNKCTYKLNSSSRVLAT